MDLKSVDAFSFRKRGTMSRKETILPAASIDGRKYLGDKPRTCDYCYWWQPGKKTCILPKCYYLIPEKVPDPKAYLEGDCKTCPYGKHNPCIGYCIAKLLKDSRERKKVDRCRKK